MTRILSILFFATVSWCNCTRAQLPTIISAAIESNEFTATALLPDTPAATVWMTSCELRTWSACSTTQNDHASTTIFLPYNGSNQFVKVKQFGAPITGNPSPDPVTLGAWPLGSNSVALAWNSISNAAGYLIQRASATNGAEWQTIGTNTGELATSFLDSVAPINRTSYYRVTAFN
jgi:hypothetical protein